MRVPVVLLTGTHPDAMATTMVSLQFDLPHAVAVRHHIDPDEQILERVVSDVTGIVEHEFIRLDHACVSCALREDVLPTLERVARDPRWRTVIAHLPVSAPAAQVCSVLARDTRLARYLRISAVIAALSGAALVDDLLGDHLLVDRGLNHAADDRRGLGEVTSAMIEYADVIAVDGVLEPDALDLVRALAQPDARLVTDPAELDALVVTGTLHRHGNTHAWIDPLRTPRSPTPAGNVWAADLSSPFAFDPARLLDGLDALAGGRHRSRGCFWLPTRPERLVVWDGSGGQLSIGDGGTWAGRTRTTRLIMTGVGAEPDHLRATFDRLLAGGAPGARAFTDGDGFEPWLGPIRDVA